MKRLIVFLCLTLCLNSQVLFAAPQAYFSPDGNIQQRIVERIQTSVDTIDVMCFNFTSRTLAKSLIEAKKRGVRIRILLDRSGTENRGSMYSFLKKGGLDIKRLSGLGKDGIMHNKVAVFDSKCVLTGSYNWTTSAEHYNYENAVFLDDAQLIFNYQSEFNKLWNEGK